MYKMSQFCSMVGMNKSKVRFYEKKGLFETRRKDNNYRAFSPEDAFRVNAFLVLLQYGFTVDEAIGLMDKKQSGEAFFRRLEGKQKELERQKQELEYRVRRIQKTLAALKSSENEEFFLAEVEDKYYANASTGLDFSPAVENTNILKGMYACLFASHCCRLIPVEEILSGCEQVNPSYINAIPVSDMGFLEGYETFRLKRLTLGRCLIHTRKKTRRESAVGESFQPLREYLEKNRLKPRGEQLLIMPSFLNLDAKGSDIEVLILPVEDDESKEL